MATLGKGITNKQAKYLAALCREMKVPYSGRGMTSSEASMAITVMKDRIAQRNGEQREGKAVVWVPRTPTTTGPSKAQRKAMAKARASTNQGMRAGSNRATLRTGKTK